MRWAEVE